MKNIALTLPWKDTSKESVNAIIQNPLSSKGSQFSDLGSTLGSFLNLIFAIAAFLLFIWLVWGTVQYIFAGGDKEGLGNARKRMIAAIIGFVIVALSFALAQYVEQIFDPQFRSPISSQFVKPAYAAPIPPVKCNDNRGRGTNEAGFIATVDYPSTVPSNTKNFTVVIDFNNKPSYIGQVYYIDINKLTSFTSEAESNHLSIPSAGKYTFTFSQIPSLGQYYLTMHQIGVIPPTTCKDLGHLEIIAPVINIEDDLRTTLTPIPLSKIYGFGNITSLGDFLSKAVKNLVFPICGIAIVIYFLLGAFNLLTSAGEKEKVEKARNMITHAIIGFVLLMLIFAALQFFFDFFGLSFPIISP